MAAVLSLLLVLSGEAAAALGARTVTLDTAEPPGTPRVYLPFVMRDDPMRTQRLCRFGVGVESDIVHYPVNELRIGWYTNWGTSLQPSRPGGIEYLQMIRLSQIGHDSYSSTPQGSALLAVIAANPGALWVIGNEPDRFKWQDSVEPAIYARAYHDLYQQIKAADPTARIAAGSIVQPTPLRLQYLDMILESYVASYGQPMPVDVWNIHAFILNEQSCNPSCPGYQNCWGAEIPPGMTDCTGNTYTIDDNDSLSVFKQFIVDFRQWMADRGYREQPLIITEYGVLMPEDYGFPPSRVNAYMNATFDYLSTAAGPTGYPADKDRLVQAWAWYSLTDSSFNGWLYDAQTGARTAFGDNFAAYTAAVSPVINLTPVKLWSEPIAGAGPDQTVELVAQVANTGNVAMAGPSYVRFYDGDPANGGALIGADQILPALNGCGITAKAAVSWSNVPTGTATVWVVVDPFNVSPESDESDNQLSTVIKVGP